MKQMIKKLAVVLSVTLVCAPIGAMAANKLIVKNAAGTSDAMVVTDTGFIGIGKSTPTVALDVVGVPGAARLVAHTVGDSNIGGGSFIGLHNNAPTTNSGLPRISDRIGFFLFGSRTGVTAQTPQGTATVTGGGIQVYAGGNWTPTSYPTYFTFETTPDGSITKAERLRVLANGNIGIGTIAPTQKLDINGGVRLVTSTAKPACDATLARGTMWFTRGLPGVADKLEVCAKDNLDAYAWKALF